MTARVSHWNILPWVLLTKREWIFSFVGGMWEGIEEADHGNVVGSLGALAHFQQSCSDMPSPSPQDLSLPWSTSTPSSRWPCPVSWSFQTEVGT